MRGKFLKERVVGCMKVSIRDISTKTGFSPATVSNALNHKRGVNKETAAKVFRVAEEMGYIVENSITRIKLIIFKKNGSIIDDTPFFSTLISGMEQECRQCGYEMVVCNADQRDADYRKQVKMLLNDAGCGSVVLGTEMMPGDLDIFRGAKSPLVVLEHWSELMEFNGVLINNADSGRMATQYLIDKGHREIGYLRGAYRIAGFRSRYVGYQIALRKNHLELNNAYTVTLGTTSNGAYQDMLLHLEQNSKLPTAFFADNDMIALGAMKALQEKGIRIPEDISIVGFDDLPFSKISSPPLTTIQVPSAEMGRLAVHRVVELIKNPSPVVTKTQVCTRFIERDTVKQLN